MRENEDFKHKFRFYCTDLEKRLKRDFNAERQQMKAKITKLEIEIENLKEQKNYEYRMQESLVVKKYKLKKVSLKEQLRFLSERLYISDFENRKLLIEIGILR